ncbi:protoporphyrinogen oxidase [Halalkalibacterium halodurans]|uniref:protoporphyrinogen oxidase n=1 Tax=Halalkalibacterium halodurans TaxID=86665 RepID=UPI002E2355F7|nr:protoporphyrinogen oxidase [Halalkalibacterium halodurans]MED4122384.1 protoporphyrinogen oxidase [Halalkalibacterium halodurans]
MTTNNHRVAVIGGGMTGLAAAWALQKARKQMPIEYELIEASAQLGGKIQTDVTEGFVIERGPDSYLARKESMTRLAREVGLEGELVRNDTGQAYILKNDQLYPIPGGAIMGIPTAIGPFIRSRLFSSIGKLRAAQDLVIPSFTHENEDVSLGYFFRKRLGDEVVDQLIEPLLSGIYAGDLDTLSLQATFPQFQQLEAKYGSLIRGIKASKGKQSQSQVGKKQGMFLTFRRGLQSFIETIEQHLDEKAIRKKTEVRFCEREGKRYRLTFNDGTVQTYDHVILTTPPYVTGRLLEPYVDVDYMREMKATTVATVAMAFKSEDLHIPYEGTGFVVPRKSRYEITACTWTHKKWRHTTPEGHALVRCYVGKPGSESIVHETDEAIVEQVQKDLDQIMTVKREPLFYKVTRWKKAMPQYEVGHRYKLEKVRQELKKAMPGIILAGAGFDGIGLPDCIDQGEAAVATVLEEIL